MRDYKRIRGPRQAVMRFWVEALAVLFLFGLTAGATRAAWSMYEKFVEASAGDAQASAELAHMEQQKAQMSKAVDDLSTPRGVEAQVRQRYGVEKPGEGVIEIVSAPTSTASEPAPQPGLFGRIWQMLRVW